MPHPAKEFSTYSLTEDSDYRLSSLSKIEAIHQLFILLTEIKLPKKGTNPFRIIADEISKHVPIVPMIVFVGVKPDIGIGPKFFVVVVDNP
jgi:hypothetical protein